MQTRASSSGRATGTGGATGNGSPPPAAGPHARAWEIVLEVVREHAPSLLRIARRHSMCADDAQDAYQRAIEIFVGRAESLEPDTTVGWLRTVVKHEAMAVRAARRVGPEEVDLDAREDVRLVPVDERAASFERLTRSAEALARCKPHEARALLLKAEGHSYHEICRITGWTYTKVNRLLTEGRRTFLDRYAVIEAGDECERWTPVLSAMADGEATAAQLVDARPHLRRCAACRATLREFHWAPSHVGAVAPLAAAPHHLGGAGHGGHAVLMRLYEAAASGLHERVTTSALKLQSAVELVSASKVAAVAASTAALAGGGIAVDAALDGGQRQRAALVGAGRHGPRPHRQHHRAPRLSTALRASMHPSVELARSPVARHSTPAPRASTPAMSSASSGRGYGASAPASGAVRAAPRSSTSHYAPASSSSSSSSSSSAPSSSSSRAPSGSSTRSPSSSSPTGGSSSAAPTGEFGP